MTNHTRDLSHQEASELLPWLANGTLSDNEQRLVKAHLRNCAHCRQDLEQHSSLAGLMQQLQPGHAPLPADEARRRVSSLLQRADQSARRNAQSPATSRHVRPGRLLHRVLPLRWQRMAAAAGMVVCALIILNALPMSREAPPAHFTTLSDPATLAPGHYVRVVFQPELDADTIVQTISQVDARITAGPTARGVYTLAVDTATVPAALRTLQASPLVLFAEAVYIGDP